MSEPHGGLVLIDTSAWICYFSQRKYGDIKQAVSSLIEENRAALTGPVRVELIQGCKGDGERRLVEELLNGLYYLPVKEEHWQMTADLSFGLRRKGVTVSVVDSLIAAIAMSYGYPLLHRDSDFDHIARHERRLKILR